MIHTLLSVLAVLTLEGVVQDAPLDSEAYPNLKWGFTTQNFIAVTPVSVAQAKAFITYANEEGYQWIELRDPDASLSLADCQEIAAFARRQGVEINYSVQRGLLHDDFWEVFNQAVVNTAVFDGPGFVRILAFIGEGDYGWTAEEFEKAVRIANQAAIVAAQAGVRFTVENADTALDGRDEPYYGLWEFFAETDPAVTLQLDTANLFTGPVAVTAEEAAAFIEAYADRTSYLHLKSAKDGQALPYLADNPLSLEQILATMHEAGVYYIALELNSGDADEQQIYANMAKSVDYLVEQGLISGR